MTWFLCLLIEKTVWKAVHLKDFSWKGFLMEAACSWVFWRSFLVMKKIFKKKKSWSDLPQLNLLVPWESCDWILPPWQQTSYIMGKSQKPNRRLLRGLVEESHLCCNVENREWLCPGRYACAYSFMQQVFIKQHHGVGRTLCQVSSFATYKLGDVRWQIWAWLFFPEICSVDLMERVHVKAPVHVRLGLGNVDECGCS